MVFILLSDKKKKKQELHKYNDKNCEYFSFVGVVTSLQFRYEG